jgi:hypothetical protein
MEKVPHYVKPACDKNKDMADIAQTAMVSDGDLEPTAVLHAGQEEGVASRC